MSFFTSYVITKSGYSPLLHIARPGRVRLSVYNIIGQDILTLVDAYQPQGAYSVVFDGSGLTSGVYISSLEYEGSVRIGKMLLVK